MQFDYAYRGHTAVQNSATASALSFVPDATRPPTHFEGSLRTGIEFREAISALHDVVISDLRYTPKDREAYQKWLAEQEERDLIRAMSQSARVQAEVEAIERQLRDVDRRVRGRMQPFWNAQRRYFDYLYTRDYAAWLVLDPVITVHPDQVFFECFSKDESTYGCLAARYDEFDTLGERACGTTNIDYSAQLYDEFQKIRTYKTTTLKVDPGGFEVATTGEETLREVKIDLPDSWVRGFLQVSSAMSLPATTVELHPLDVYNFCLFLRRNRETRGPRSMRYCLTPGEPVKVVFDPWNHVIECPRSIYRGPEATEIRVWGRRRIHILERLIPVAKRFTVHLLGKGMPSFYVADMGTMVFTLGLSGWTANDWSTAGNFDLMAPRAEVDDDTKRQVFEGLKDTWLATPDELSARLGFERSTVLGALGAWTQAGRAIYDLHAGVYRARELSRDPLPMSQLRFASEREADATDLLDRGKVRVRSQRLDGEGNLNLSGTVRAESRTLDVSARIDEDERLRFAECGCRWHFQNKLRRGPCAHILALRMAAARSRRL